MHRLFAHLTASLFIVAMMVPIAPAFADHGDEGNQGSVHEGDHEGDQHDGFNHDHGDDDGNEGDVEGGGDTTCDSARCAILAQVQASCPCDTSSRLRYLACVVRTAGRLVESRSLPRRCVGRVIGCALNSTCGRSGAVACAEPRFGFCDVRHSRCIGSGKFCSTFKDCPLPPKCDIESSSSHCTEEHGLVLTQTSCCGDCTATTTTTSTTVPSSSSSSATSTSNTSTSTSTTATTAPLCGNGVKDPGEECDPPGSPTCADPSSPTGALLCQPGCVCPSVSSTSIASTTSTSTSSSSSSVPTTVESTSSSSETSTSTSTSSSTSLGSASGAFLMSAPASSRPRWWSRDRH